MMAKTLLASGLSYAKVAARMDITKGQLAGALWRAAGNKDSRKAFMPTEVIKEHWFVGGCRWVFGDPKGEWRWCGAATERGHSWCREHELIGWVGGKVHPLTILR